MLDPQLVLDWPLDVVGHLYITFSHQVWLASLMVSPFPIGGFEPKPSSQYRGEYDPWVKPKPL